MNPEVEYIRLASAKAQLKLEKLGLKSKGGALRPRLSKEFGLSPRAPHWIYIDECERRMEKLLK